MPLHLCFDPQDPKNKEKPRGRGELEGSLERVEIDD
jgi:hypothetical protein